MRALAATGVLNEAEIDELASSRGQGRRSALEVLRARGETERTRRLALADPAEKVRDWARRLPVGRAPQ